MELRRSWTEEDTDFLVLRRGFDPPPRGTGGNVETSFLLLYFGFSRSTIRVEERRMTPLAYGKACVDRPKNRSPPNHGNLLLFFLLPFSPPFSPSLRSCLLLVLAYPDLTTYPRSHNVVNGGALSSLLVYCLHWHTRIWSTIRWSHKAVNRVSPFFSALCLPSCLPAVIMGKM